MVQRSCCRLRHAVIKMGVGLPIGSSGLKHLRVFVEAILQAVGAWQCSFPAARRSLASVYFTGLTGTRWSAQPVSDVSVYLLTRACG